MEIEKKAKSRKRIRYLPHHPVKHQVTLKVICKKVQCEEKEESFNKGKI